MLAQKNRYILALTTTSAATTMQDIKMTAQIVEKLRSLSAAADRCCTNDIEIHLVATWNSCMCVCGEKFICGNLWLILWLPL